MSTLIQNLTYAVKNWYLSLIFGILFLVFGFYIFRTPLESYVSLSIFFSIIFLISGISEIIFSLQNSKSLQGWGWLLASGILTTVIGFYLVMYPQVTMAVLPFIVGFTVLFRSFELLGFSFDLKNMQVSGWGYVTCLSILGVIFSFILVFNPIFTGMTIVTLTGLSFVFLGLASIALSFRLKKIKNMRGKISEELKEKLKAIQEEVNSSYKS